MRPQEDYPGSRPWVSWVVLLAGFSIWVGLQTWLVFTPLWTRGLPPAGDNSLAYLARAAQWDGCLFQDCPALRDLKQQWRQPIGDAEALRQLQLAGVAIPAYHPLFSLILRGLKSCTGSLMTAFKVLWSLFPLLLGLSLAAFLSSLWGRTAAGLALALLAFKVFPGTGAHLLTPSNLVLALAMLLWARLLSARRDAPWSLLLGSLALAAMHPLGGLFAILSLGIALIKVRPVPLRLWITAGALGLPLLLLLLLPVAGVQLPWFNVLQSLTSALKGLTPVYSFPANATGALLEILRLKEGLLGFLPFFLAAVVLGFCSLPQASRRLVSRISILYGAVLFLSLFHTAQFFPPGDLFLRLWIVAVALLFGAVGRGLLSALEYARRSRPWSTAGAPGGTLKRAAPLLLVAVLAGYVTDMFLAGAEQLYATQGFLQHCQSLRFAPQQPEILLSQAKPGDRVLYLGSIPMAFYLSQGAQQVGAVYYHPTLKETAAVQAWLARPELRFAVLYNPTVYHPLLANLDEKDRCLAFPQFHYSPLHLPRVHEPINQEGVVPAQDFWWMEVKPGREESGDGLRLQFRNPGPAAVVRCLPLDREGRPRPPGEFKIMVPGGFTGWVEVPSAGKAGAGSVRVVFPTSGQGLALAGVNWGKSTTNWPWAARGAIVFQGKDPLTGRVEVNFDLSRLLPPPLASRGITVLDDDGATALLKFD